MSAIIILLTETASDHRARALKKFKHAGWNVLIQTEPHDYLGEVSIAYDGHLKVVWWKTVKIGPDLGFGLPTILIMAVFDDPETGLRHSAFMSHFPSKVEADILAGRMKAPRVGAWLKVAAEYRSRVRYVNRKYKVDVSTAGNDWNVNLLTKVGRALVQAVLPGHRLPIDTTGDTGTHGPRQIDGLLVRLMRKAKRVLKSVLKVQVLPPHPHSDHDGVALTLETKR